MGKSKTGPSTIRGECPLLFCILTISSLGFSTLQIIRNDFTASRFVLVFILTCFLFLIGCGGGETSQPPQPPSQEPVVQEQSQPPQPPSQEPVVQEQSQPPQPPSQEPVVQEQSQPPQPPNQRPVAQGQSLRTQANQNIDITLSGTDSDGSITGFSITEQLANGTLSGTPPNLVYIPENDFDGNDQFQFTVIDNDGAVSDPVTVSIVVVGIIKVSVVDGEGFDVGQHGGRIVETFWQYTDTDTASLVKSSNNKLHSIFTDLDSEITKEIDDVEIGGINTRGFIYHLEVIGDHGIFWTASDSFPSSYENSFFDDQHQRYFSERSKAVAEWISDRNVLYIASIENTTLGPLKNPSDPLDRSRDMIYCDEDDDLCGELDDYIAYTRVGIENTIFVGAIQGCNPTCVGTGSIREDGVFADNTVYTYANSTSHAVAVVAAIAANIAEELQSELGRIPTSTEIKDALFEEVVETDMKYDKAFSSSGSVILEDRSNIKVIGEIPSVFPGS